MAPRGVDGEHVTAHQVPGRNTGPSPVPEPLADGRLTRQLPDDSLVAAWSFTGADRVTHAAGTRRRI